MDRTTNTTAVTAAIVMATFLAALDTTVVGTAMPTVIGTMGGLALYSWVFSAYLLTSTTTVPVYGRLADTYGRKPIFVVGASLFLAGSALCGSAGTMEELILFRAVQGLGAGAVLPVSITVVGDIFSIERRAGIQGLLSGVWGVSAILGPAVGGVIVDRLDWRWVFYINIPFGLLSILLFTLYLREAVDRRPRPVDYVGAAGLTAAISLLLLGLLAPGQDDLGLAIPSWTLLSASSALLCLFLLHEARSQDPLLPLGLFRKRIVSVSNAAGFLMGAALLGVSSYVPPFVQGVLGGTATNAGATLAPISIGWTAMSPLSSRLILRYGYRPVIMLGAGLVLLGSLLLLPVGPRSTQLHLMLSMMIIGLGMGLSMPSFTVAVQSAVGWGERGIATASNQFSRSIGGAIGVAAMGALMNDNLREGLQRIGQVAPEATAQGRGVSTASIILDPVARTSLPIESLSAMRDVLASSLHSVYAVIVLASLVGLILAMLFPGGSVDRHAHDGPNGSGSTGPREGDSEG